MVPTSGEAIVVQGSSRYVITTISSSASKVLRDSFKPDIAIIDEAGNAVESETLTVMANFCASVKIWLLVGDHVQLPPVVTSLDQKAGPLLANPFARQMRQSLIERMMVRGYPIPMFVEQRRLVAGLMAPVPSIFYNDMLINGPGTSLAKRPMAQAAVKFLQPFCPTSLSCPLVFFNVRQGCCKKDPVTQSRYNEQDAQAVVRLVRAYLRSVDVAAESITVITPYRQQNTRIHQLLVEGGAQGNFNPFFRYGHSTNKVASPAPFGPTAQFAALHLGATAVRVRHLRDVLVETADSAQDHDNDTIIFTPVATMKVRRDENVGYVAERSRLCVARSRAKNCMMDVVTLLSTRN